MNKWYKIEPRFTPEGCQYIYRFNCPHFEGCCTLASFSDPIYSHILREKECLLELSEIKTYKECPIVVLSNYVEEEQIRLKGE